MGSKFPRIRLLSFGVDHSARAMRRFQEIEVGPSIASALDKLGLFDVVSAWPLPHGSVRADRTAATSASFYLSSTK